MDNMDNTEVTAVEYRPTRRCVKVLKSGVRKAKASAFYVRVRTSRGWQEVATLVKGGKEDPLWRFSGTMSEDKAKVAISALMPMFGLVVPPSVAAAAAEAKKRLEAAAARRLERTLAFLDAGVEAARAAAADRAEDRWGRLDLFRPELEKALQRARERVETAANA